MSLAKLNNLECFACLICYPNMSFQILFYQDLDKTHMKSFSLIPINNSPESSRSLLRCIIMNEKSMELISSDIPLLKYYRYIYSHTFNNNNTIER